MADLRERHTGSMTPSAGIRSILFVTVSLVLACGTIPAAAEEPEGTGLHKTARDFDRNLREFFAHFGFDGFGLQSSAVFTEDYDPGFGLGLRLPREFPVENLTITTSFDFWGASNDSVDVTNIGMEETLALSKSATERTAYLSGITAGYYGLITTEQVSPENTTTAHRHQTNSFQVFLTMGIRHDLDTTRRLFLQLNYRVTDNKKEIHLIAALHFR